MKDEEKRRGNMGADWGSPRSWAARLDTRSSRLYHPLFTPTRFAGSTAAGCHPWPPFGGASFSGSSSILIQKSLG